MCNKNTPMRGKKRPRKTLNSWKPKHRKKPKYLSLKLQLCNKQEKEEEEEEEKKLIELFPLRPKNINSQVKVHNKVVADLQDDHVAFLFEAATDGASTTLDGLLDSSLTTATSSDEHSYQLSPNLQTHLPREALRSRGGCGASSLLVRAAIRSKEREESKEEKWVSYNEVVEGISTSTSSKKEQEEVTSCCGDDDASWVKIEKDQQLVGLKLENYQDILDAWSDKDPFCLGHSNPQLVPALYAAPTVWLEGWNSNVENLWRVPQMDTHIQLKEKDKEQKGLLKSEQREASVLRYKKKRQSRLFAKRIRYQVRKLNAEKRPRIKGRFVKRSEEP